MAKNISRKEFLKATAMSAAGIGLLGAGVLNAKAEEEKPVHKNSSKWVLDSQNVKWDEEHDIVICGYGMAGTAAYIEAYEIDHNVDAVIYDKSDEANAGGQAIASGQCVIFVDPNDLETWRTYMRAMNEPHVIPEEDFNWLTNEFATDLPWIQAVLEPVDYEVGYSGGGALRWGTLLVEFPDLPGANFVGATGHFRDKNGGLSFENGGCWNGFDKAARYRGAKPLYEHQVICLVQDAITKKVEGVGVKKPDGSVIYTKARKGVLLATGGYEGDMDMYRQFNGGDRIYNAGSPYVTGDGVKMEMALGAQRDNVTQFELIPWLLGQCATLCEARELLGRINLLNEPFSPELPLAQLHWLIADQTGSITVESTADGLHVYDNPVGVLTNNPPFPMQLFQLNNYMALSPESPKNTFAPDAPLTTYSRGMGAMGLPGDLSSQSRFVRVAFTRAHSLCKPTEESRVNQFFHILTSVEQQRGCCSLGDGKYEITLYSSCCNATRGIYYYTTYDNRQITAVDMHNENLDSDVLIRYPLLQSSAFLKQN